MYAITGITGKVGGALADALLNAGLPVRAVVRDAAKGEVWKARGCEVAIAEMEDSEALAEAFAGAFSRRHALGFGEAGVHRIAVAIN